MRKTLFLILAISLYLAGPAQVLPAISVQSSFKMQKDSVLKARMHADSLAVEKEFALKEKQEEIGARMVYPVLNAGLFSGVVPVANPTEVPDPTLTYKLLFELTESNPDSTISDINDGLTEVARILNLHVASGIPLKKIVPVVVVHGGALNAFTTNEAYRRRFHTDNPNLKLIGDMKALGVQFIACGQAMAFRDVKREALLPLVKVSLTAQTVLSSYQLKGFVLYAIETSK